MALVKVNKDPSTRDLRQFAGIWLPLACLIIGWMIQRRTGEWTVSLVIWAVCAAMALAGLAQPKLIKPVFVGMMYAVFPIGFVLSYCILAIVYYLVITPVGLIMRLVGYDPMERKLDRETDTYWKVRDNTQNASQYFRQI